MNTLAMRSNRLGELLSRLTPIPESWFDTPTATTRDGTQIRTLPCSSYNELVLAWRKAMRWTVGLDQGLSVMLACAASTNLLGSQLWVKIIGPPSCGKTTLAEGLSINKDHVIAKSVFRGFHSGHRGGEGDEDNKSLILKIKGKTLIVKDGDSLLKQPNIAQILGEARDVFDLNSRSDFKNGQGMDHEGVRATWIMCGTKAIKAMDRSELGERFLDCVVMEEINDEEEDEILWRVVNRTDRNLAIEADGTFESNYDEDQIYAMQLTGGYLDYLRKNAASLVAKVESPDHYLKLATRFGKFVAYMRTKQDKSEDPEREFAPRLVEQHWRLAKLLAVVMNRSSVDKEIINRTHKVAMDTARGRSLDVTKLLYNSPEGLSTPSISNVLLDSEHKTSRLLAFMRKLGMVEPFRPPSIAGIQQRVKWRLTHKINVLYKNVMVDWID